MRRLIVLPAALFAGTVAMSALFPDEAAARPVRHHAKAHKTHRILAGSKAIRIDNSGAVITNEHP